MSLVDEIMEIVTDYAACSAHREQYPSVANRQAHDFKYCELCTRLTAIETELNDLRILKDLTRWLMVMPEIDVRLAYQKHCEASRRFYTADETKADMIRILLLEHAVYRTPVPPRVESHSTLVNGLPCSNVSDWDDETGG